MGRNKKGKKTAQHEPGSEPEPEGKPEEQEQPTPLDRPEQDDNKSESASSEEKVAVKKKVYHGNKLNRKGGKGAKGQQEGKECEPETDEVSRPVVVDSAGDERVPEESDAKREELEDLSVPRNEPVDVLYCPNCTFPAEYCEFSGMYEQCRPWLLEHAKELAEAEERGRKRRALTEKERLERLVQGRGSKKGIERIVLIEVSQRKGSKNTTSVEGLDLFGLNLKDLSRDWKKMFSCGAGVKTSEELKQSSIHVQGNVVAQLIEMLPERYNIPKDAIYQIVDKKKVKCYE
ncbi:putative Translation initiation factor SUI1 [Trypanosoma vivax]|nr:hypothetical protein TRVL_04306 [Trypanosoma vivax]KAH8619114.1 putative Translation initiation factor SUI1 [Trypanosoma vivax]